MIITVQIKLNREQEPERSVARRIYQGTEAGPIKMIFNKH